MSKEAYNLYKKKTDIKLNLCGLQRMSHHNTTLIKVVKVLGTTKASGRYSNL